MMNNNSLLQLIGNTPLIRLQVLDRDCPGNVWVKLEHMNPGGSVKDRIALNMIRREEESGSISPDTVFVEPTSGNTGIGLAMVCAAKGYRLILTMPETMSMERRQLLKAYGAEIILTPGDQGMRGAINKAQELIDNNPDAIMLDQFSNLANPEAHRLTTGPEIHHAIQGSVDYFVAGIGTGGTITGVTEYLREHYPDMRSVGVEPAASAVLSGNPPGPHPIQGIGAGFIPSILKSDLIHKIITVEAENAFQTSRQLAKQEGLLCGISAGANVYAALQVASRQEAADKNIITVICDTGERYLSTTLFNETF